MFEIQIVRISDAVVVIATDFGKIFADVENPVLVLHVRPGFKQERVNYRKRRGRRADAERQRQPCDDGECRCFDQHSRAETNIVPHGGALQLCRDTIVFHHATVEQMHGAVRMLREARVVRYHADRRTAGVQFF